MRTLEEMILDGYKKIDLPQDDTLLKEFIEEIYDEFNKEMNKIINKIDNNSLNNKIKG